MKNFGMASQQQVLLVLLLPIVAGTLLLAGCTSDKRDSEQNSAASVATHPNSLNDAERAAGWRLLFDGETFVGWRGLGREGVPQGHWVIEDGTIRKVASGDVPTQADGQPLEGGDLMTTGTFEDFELSFEWKLRAGGNSGVKYNVSEEMSTKNPPKYAALGFEYQILDDDKHADGDMASHRTASLYDLIAPGPEKRLRTVGEFNTSRIVFRGAHGEHWLNGDKVVEYELGTPRFDSLLAASKYAPIEGFADRRSGHIVLQDHSDDVWFRNIKIRDFSSE